MLKEEKQKIYSEIVEFLKSKGATKVAVFGSYVRNEEREDSDIDVMVDFKNPITLFDFAGYQIELQNKLKKKVDLILEGGMNPVIKKYAEKDYMILHQ